MHVSYVYLVCLSFMIGSVLVSQLLLDVYTSDSPAILMEWLTNGVVVGSDILTQQLDLVFSQVNDSILNLVYVCRVTRLCEIPTTQSFTVKVDGKVIYMHVVHAIPSATTA